MRLTFGWGTARIQQDLYNLPEFILNTISCVQGIRLSREAINNVLIRHHMNRHIREQKSWKFFRAKKPDELWQIYPIV